MELGFEPRAAWWEARMLLLCYAAPNKYIHLLPKEGCFLNSLRTLRSTSEDKMLRLISFYELESNFAAKVFEEEKVWLLGTEH